MAVGRKTGGRQAGTPKRKTAEVAERLAALHCDPLQGMAVLAMDETNPPELRGRMYAELAGYHLYAKRKAVEHAAEGAGEFRITWSMPDVDSLPG
jgi:hypothetical protein